MIFLLIVFLVSLIVVILKPKRSNANGRYGTLKTKQNNTLGIISNEIKEKQIKRKIKSMWEAWK